MNKRFSTLLATLLVAGGLSSSAWADTAVKDYKAGPGTVEDGEYTFLCVGDADNVLSIGDGNVLTKISAPSTGLSAVNKALWKVSVIKSTSVAGGNTYKFQNKATGQWLAIDLKSDKAAGSANFVTSDGNVKVGGANSTWGWDATKGLYAVKGDSIFTLTADTDPNTQFNLTATKGETPGATAVVIGYDANLKENLKLPLTADEFNTLTKGKLYFKGGKDVSTGNANVLTANTWKAVEEVADGSGSSTSANYVNLKNAAGKYLVVDTVLYTGTTYDSDPAFKLNVDTVYKESTAPTANDVNKAAKQRFKAAYEFQPIYCVSKDSIVLLIASHPTYNENGKPSQWSDSHTNYGSNKTGQIILRTLANATILTVEATDNIVASPKAYVVEPLIQPTAGNIGGTAKIAADKVYYVANMEKYVGDKENTAYGKFYDINRPNQAHYLNAGQAFNAGSQFVVEATPGADHGNYTIKQRFYDMVVWEGVADSTADGSIVILPTTTAQTALTKMGINVDLADTIKLVDAGLEYKDAVEYATFHASDFALKNKQFKIQSASPLLGSDMFIHMKKDSTLALQDGEVLYSFKHVGNVPVKSASIKDAVAPLSVEAYEISTKDGQYLVYDGKNYLLTADPAKYLMTVTYKYNNDKSETLTLTNTAFIFIPTEAADKYVVAPVFPRVEIAGASKSVEKRSVTLKYSNVSCKVVVDGDVMNHDATETKDVTVAYSGVIHDLNPGDVKDRMITVNTNTGDLENRIQGTAKYDLFYVAEEDDPQSLFSMPKHIQIETTNNQFVTVNTKNEALVVAENALKAANYTAEDFTFWLDTAAYNRNGETLVAPSYYVTRGVAADTTTKVDAHRLYMYNAADSAAKATVNKEQYLAYGSTRVIFREALRYGADSLIVAGDTLTLDGKATATIAKPKAGVANFRFNFLQAKDEAEGVYNIKSGDNYLRNLNGVLVIGDAEEAVMVTVNATDAPTANEGVEVSEVKVIASEGSVQIVGAQGKKVVVTNILGQVVANTVIASDNAVIAAPQGVVVVAVEGEEAVKAIVK
ncbi:DUF6383 domain-containing protein [Parabacteroides sp.]